VDNSHITFSVYAKCEAKPSIWVRALARTAYTVLYAGSDSDRSCHPFSCDC